MFAMKCRTMLFVMLVVMVVVDVYPTRPPKEEGTLHSRRAGHQTLCHEALPCSKLQRTTATPPPPIAQDSSRLGQLEDRHVCGRTTIARNSSIVLNDNGSNSAPLPAHNEPLR